MPKRKRIRVCSVCGTIENVNRSSLLCLMCAVERVHEAGQQLQLKEGPIYEKWRAGLLKHLRGVTETD